ncbi:hypothetical protein IU427_09940 [Nocardia beijingensis]|uniref:hypothetical protein n=1 Tax=Nocardia beijingensis TaxID=95162 RepID=UPI0018953C2A|nr:hypothetical protein [Nocardia beijingensis]MBF6465495.1 hypothetical protein [Nocardia beijingensis]
MTAVFGAAIPPHLLGNAFHLEYGRADVNSPTASGPPDYCCGPGTCRRSVPNGPMSAVSPLRSEPAVGEAEDIAQLSYASRTLPGMSSSTQWPPRAAMLLQLV